MTPLLNAVLAVGRTVSNEHGRLELLGLFRRAGADKWDLVAAASWMDARRAVAIGVLSDALKAVVGGNGMMQFSRVATLSTKDRFRNYLPLSPRAGALPHRIGPGDYGGVTIEDGYLFPTSARAPRTPSK